MSDQSIQGVVLFSQEVAALAAAGLPLDFGDGKQNQASKNVDRSLDSITSMLDQANTALTMRVGRGQSIEQAVMEEPLLSPNYRKSLLTYLRCDDSRLALESLSFPASTQRRFAMGIGNAMVYPLIVLAIAYLGFMYLCQFTGPTLESMYRDGHQTPPPAVLFLSNARHWIPIWGPLVPIVIAMLVVWWNARGSKLSWNWLPGSQDYYRAVRNAHNANQLAGMLENGCELKESLATVFCESIPIENGPQSTNRMQANLASQEPSSNSIDLRITEELPPLLRWAIAGDTGDEPLPKVLRFVAMTYQQTAERQERVWRIWTPMVAGLAIGGLLVLGYGLSLFLPVVQMLKDVAIPGSGLGGV